jgi:acyl-coenzyme A thioesterase PaaI-like protein
MDADASGSVNLPDGAVPDPDHPGWYTGRSGGVGGAFSGSLGRFLYRPDGPGRAVCRIFPGEELVNPGGSINGGAVLTFIDWALFAGGLCAGLSKGHHVTLDLHNHFAGRARAGKPLDAEVTLVKETSSLAFLSGRCVQDGDVCSVFTGTLKKVRPPR